MPIQQHTKDKENPIWELNKPKSDVEISVTKQTVSNQVEHTIKESILDQTLESYPFLSSAQKELITQINANHPNAIEKITPQAITVVTEKGRFELPLVDTEHPDLKEHTNMPQEFLDKRNNNKLWLTKHKYYTGHAIDEYYKSTWESKLSQEEIESIITLMPSWDTYQYATRWQSMKQFTILLWLTDKDLTSWADSDGSAGSGVLGQYGGAWLGAESSSSHLLRTGFDSGEAGLNRTDRDYAFRARLLKKLSS